MNTTLAVVTWMAIKDMDSIVLAAAYNGLTGFGYIDPRNIAFTPMYEAALINENGKPRDEENLLAALSMAINQRNDDGRWE
jgi:hypothetical protein